MKKPYDVLKAAFGRLSDKQLRRLWWHAKVKTPICCGRLASQFVVYLGNDSRLACCPAVMACTTRPGKTVRRNWTRTWWDLCGLEERFNNRQTLFEVVATCPYMVALKRATPAVVRRAMRDAAHERVWCHWIK